MTKYILRAISSHDEGFPQQFVYKIRIYINTMELDFNSICAHVNLFTVEIRQITQTVQTFKFNSRIIPSTKSIQLKAEVNAPRCSYVKSVNILHDGTNWTIDAIPMLDITKVRSLYLPFVFRNFQLGVMHVKQWASRKAGDLGWNYEFFENNGLMPVSGLNQNTFSIRLIHPHLLGNTYVIHIDINKMLDNMCSYDLHGTLSYTDGPELEFTSVRELETRFFNIQERPSSRKTPESEPRDSLNSQAVWTALDKLATMITKLDAKRHAPILHL